jgi:hypothetical protein
LLATFRHFILRHPAGEFFAERHHSTEYHYSNTCLMYQHHYRTDTGTRCAIYVPTDL